MFFGYDYTNSVNYMLFTCINKMRIYITVKIMKVRNQVQVGKIILTRTKKPIFSTKYEPNKNCLD